MTSRIPLSMLTLVALTLAACAPAANMSATQSAMDAMHAEETLVFSSDWPHWDWDDPATTFPKLPERLHQRVFCENAREMFGL